MKSHEVQNIASESVLEAEMPLISVQGGWGNREFCIIIGSLCLQELANNIFWFTFHKQHKD